MQSLLRRAPYILIILIGVSCYTNYYFTSNTSEFEFTLDGIRSRASPQYCQAGMPHQLTYRPLQDAKLLQVQIVARHGDRTPIHSYSPDQVVEFTDCDEPVKNTPVHESSQRPFVAPLWRGNCDKGQLTSKGRGQIKLLGREFKAIYGKLLWKQTDVGDGEQLWVKRVKEGDILVRSTDVRRTISCATHFLSAFMETPVSDLSHIYVPPKPEDPLSPHSPLSDVLYDELVYNFTKTISESFIQKWARVFDLEEHESRLTRIFDSSIIRLCHGMELPCRNKNGVQSKSKEDCISSEDVTLLNQLADRMVLFLNSPELSSSHKDYIRHTGAKVVQELLVPSFLGAAGSKGIESPLWSTYAKRWNITIDSRMKFKLAYYSAHDTTVSLFLGALQVPKPYLIWPPYAATVSVELWERNQAMWIRVLYMGEYINLPWCEDKMSAMLNAEEIRWALENKVCAANILIDWVESTWL
ncbi:histidine phosphatase superfamily [Paraphysoderma sedebokerense]|nr:histidine phosphatase superfamily [Paraphysoderma sedebokerense]